MGKASFRQANQILDLMDQAGWDGSGELVQTFIANWGLHRDLMAALYEGRVSEHDLRALLDWKPAAPASPTGAVQPSGIIRLKPFVDRMIRAGYHTVTDGGKGMKASDYRKLWPRTLTYPAGYAGRFDEVLLVDRTIALSALVERGNIVAHIDPSSCTDLVTAPTHLETGAPLRRYVAFVQPGKKNLGRTVESCSQSFASDEVGLVTVEGLHLPVQYEPYLRKYAVDLAGSRYGTVSAPYVSWFDNVRPHFHRDRVRHPRSNSGSASRGSQVVPVS